MDISTTEFERRLRRAIAELNRALFIGPEFSDLSLTNAIKNIRLAQTEIARLRNVRVPAVQEADTETARQPISGCHLDAQ